MWLPRVSAALWDQKRDLLPHRRSMSGDPNFPQLEPDGELAKPTPSGPTSRIVKRAGAYESLPADLRSSMWASRLLNTAAFIASNVQRSAGGRRAPADG